MPFPLPGVPTDPFQAEKKFSFFSFVNFCLALLGRHWSSFRHTPIGPLTLLRFLVILHCNCWFTCLSFYETISSLREGTVYLLICLWFLQQCLTFLLDIYSMNECVSYAFEMHKMCFSFFSKSVGPFKRGSGSRFFTLIPL